MPQELLTTWGVSGVNQTESLGTTALAMKLAIPRSGPKRTSSAWRWAPVCGSGASFADLFAQEKGAPSRFEPGQQVEATVVRTSGEWVFLDLGGKSEGSLNKNEVLDREGNLTVQEGDTIKAYFLSAERNGMLFTTRMSGAASKGLLEAAFASGIPVDGYVEKEVKGGYEVKVGGSVRAFCPFSQSGLRRDSNTDEFLECHHAFRITEYGESGRNIVLSRRAIIEEERQQQKEALRDTLEEGMTIKGVITNIRDFGAFVDIGGLEGLLPISEIGWGQVEDIRDTLHEGQEVEVAIKKLDWEADRFSFSLKDTLPDPWITADNRFPAGSVHTGKVVRLTNFGAFVALGEGIDGLVHISKLAAGKRINHPREVVEEGQALEVRVESVDSEKRRVSLVPADAQLAADSGKKGEPADSGAEDYRKYIDKGKGAGSGKSLGTLGDLLKSRLGDK